MQALLPLSAVLIMVLSLPAVSAVDNGLGLTPPRGWRSWNCYNCMTNDTILTQARMTKQMVAVIDKSRKVDGKPTSLKDLGYGWISMDDGWQQCNCSTRQAIDPRLPACSIGDCRSGKCSWHQKSTGNPLENKDRFPDMRKMVDYGHSLGLKVGTYLNNCICMEAGKSPTHYEQDVNWLVHTMDFDEVKIDNCGSSHNVTLYQELFNKSGKAIRTEDCHTYPTHPSLTKDGQLFCPMNMYRSGGDIAPNFNSIMGEIYGTVQWGDRSFPLSRPTCWAYPDMMQVGNFKGPEPTRSYEEQTHFGLWSIVSSPLVLGFDMSNGPILDRVWPLITNTDALGVNTQWNGHPGTMIKQYPSSSMKQATQGDCSSSKWTLTGGKLASNNMCVSSKGFFGPFNCPSTITSAISHCGLNATSCSDAQGTWSMKGSMLQWRNKPTDQPQCLTIKPGKLPDATGENRQSAHTYLMSCPSQPSDDSSFTLRGGQLKAKNGVCVVMDSAPGVQLWAKPLQGGHVAVLFVNPLTIPQHFDAPLSDIPNLGCASSAGSCKLRDVWLQKEVGSVKGVVPVTLAPHQSAYFILHN